jgi:hypothetical protein
MRIKDKQKNKTKLHKKNCEGKILVLGFQQKPKTSTKRMQVVITL